MVEATHTTVEPEQTKTDTFAVFADNPHDNVRENLSLVGRVEVPRYTVPTEDGVEMSLAKRLQMAVQWAVTSNETVPSEMVEGQEFMVMHDLEEPMAFAQFEENPAVAGCWNPNEESVEEFTGGDE